jgi:hypothetical protein
MTSATVQRPERNLVRRELPVFAGLLAVVVLAVLL